MALWCFRRTQLNPFREKTADGSAEAPAPLVQQPSQPLPLLAAELLVLSIGASFLMKYGETALGLPFEPSAIVGWLLVLGIPAVVGYSFVSAPDPLKQAEAQ